MLLHEFDPDRSAVIEPSMCVRPVEGFPPVTVGVFSRKLVARTLAFFPDAEPIAVTKTASCETEVWRVTWQGQQFALYTAFVGEPACLGQYEELLAMGSQRLILLGNCGVLDGSIEDCGIILPTSALRDEGASFHYAPLSDEIIVNRQWRGLFRDVLRERGYKWVEGATWTTDAPYRETREKCARRRARGALCVEMECAGMQALCDFRNTEFFQFFYAGDSLASPTWDPRSLSGDARLDDKGKIVLLAFELGLKILAAQ